MYSRREMEMMLRELRLARERERKLEAHNQKVASAAERLRQRVAELSEVIEQQEAALSRSRANSITSMRW